MFDQLQLPANLSQMMVSITPLLGIHGKIEDHKLYAITKYFPIENNKLVLLFEDQDIPDELTLNVLRKGEDSKIIKAFTKVQLDTKNLKKSATVSSPFYIHSILSFEAKLDKVLEIGENEKLGIFEILQSNGVSGLDPDFNDSITLAKTLEVMSLTAVDTYIIKKKLESLK